MKQTNEWKLHANILSIIRQQYFCISVLSSMRFQCFFPSGQRDTFHFNRSKYLLSEQGTYSVHQMLFCFPSVLHFGVSPRQPKPPYSNVPKNELPRGNGDGLLRHGSVNDQSATSPASRRILRINSIHIKKFNTS